MIQQEPIIIVGGGPIGLTTAILLAKQEKEVMLLDAGHSKLNDGRVLALSYASMNLLYDLNVWNGTVATAINTVHISHSGIGVSNICAKDINLSSLGYTVKYANICDKLESEVAKYKNIQLKTCIVEEVIPSADHATIYYTDQGDIQYLKAGLVILAEGGKIKIKNVSYHTYDYEQHALIAQIKTQKQHLNIAYERFDNNGQLVLLPYENSYMLVWSLPNQEVDEIVAQNSLLKRLRAISFMQRFGTIEVVGSLHSFPLKLQVAKSRVLETVVLIGNSAQTVHPVSAQGLNLGLRDAKILSESLSFSNTNEYNLQSFNRLRDMDAKIVIGFTHGLANFVDRSPIKYLRGMGIATIGNCRTLQNFIANSLIFGV